jgi:uncharacterized protein
VPPAKSEESSPPPTDRSRLTGRARLNEEPQTSKLMSLGKSGFRVLDDLGRRRISAIFLSANEIVAAACLALALIAPAQAQFWSPFAPTRRPSATVQQQQQPWQSYNPFGGFFVPQIPKEPRQQSSHGSNESEAPPDNSHAPSPQQRKADVPRTTLVVVMGDAMADWLAYGLEDAFMDRPEMGIARKHRTGSGLIRYSPRRDVDWAQTAREIIAAEKPKFVLMMIGVNDHQAIRERTPVPRPAASVSKPGGAAGPQSTPGQTAQSVPAPIKDEAISDPENPEQPPLGGAGAGRNSNATGPFEFHTDQWEAAYTKRIDATIAALKSGGVPVFWVGLPAQRGSKASSDASYLNELYRGRAEKAGIVFVDIWDGFVDEQGQYSPQGPDFEGQIRRLRSADGVYFTKAGALKLAHYVEREIDRSEANRALQVALPTSIEQAPAGAKAGGPSARPLVGPVIPLTASTTAGPAGSSASEELLGGAHPAASPLAANPLATRVLIKGEPSAAPAGRADDFNWPRENAASVSTEPLQPTVASVAPQPGHRGSASSAYALQPGHRGSAPRAWPRRSAP